MHLAHTLLHHPVALRATEDEPGTLLYVHDGPGDDDVRGPAGPLQLIDALPGRLGQLVLGGHFDLGPGHLPSLPEAEPGDALPSLDVGVGDGDDLVILQPEVVPGRELDLAGLVGYDPGEHGLLARGGLHLLRLEGEDPPGEGDVVHVLPQVSDLGHDGRGVSAPDLGHHHAVRHLHLVLGTKLHHHAVAEMHLGLPAPLLGVGVPDEVVLPGLQVGLGDVPHRELHGAAVLIGKDP